MIYKFKPFGGHDGVHQDLAVMFSGYFQFNPLSLTDTFYNSCLRLLGGHDI